jgi:hypothetical protein
MKTKLGSEWSRRAVRMLIVAGVAVLVGTFAGGFSVFAIVSALNAPPRQAVRADTPTPSEVALADAPVIKAAPPPPAAPPATAPDVTATAAMSREPKPSAAQPDAPGGKARAAVPGDNGQAQTRAAAAVQTPSLWNYSARERVREGRAFRDRQTQEQIEEVTPQVAETGPDGASRRALDREQGPSYSAKDGDSTLRPARRHQLPLDQRASRQAQMPPATVRQRR